LQLARQTVKNYVGEVMRKLQVRTRSAAIRKAIDKGLG
jgi:DNA-binding NarL/FixJ family response regulator